MNRLIKILIMCRKRITFIICIFSLSLILNDTLAESPNYKINLSGSGSTITTTQEVTANTIALTTHTHTDTAGLAANITSAPNA